MPVLTPNWNKVEVRGKYVGIDGLPMAGRVVFTPQANRMVDAAALTTIVGRAIAVQLDADGAFSVFLPATDDPDIIGHGFTYKMREEFVNGVETEIAVPLSRMDTGIDVSVYLNVTPHEPAVPASVLRVEYDAFVGETEDHLAEVDQRLGVHDGFRGELDSHETRLDGHDAHAQAVDQHLSTLDILLDAANGDIGDFTTAPTLGGTITLGVDDANVIKTRGVEIATDQRAVTLGYLNGNLDTITEKAAGVTVKVTTLYYTSNGLLEMVREVAGGTTTFTTFSRDVTGDITSITRSSS